MLINDSADLSTGENLVFMIGGGEEGNFKELGYGGLIVVVDGSTTLTVSIRQEVTTVTKLSGKYVEGMGYTETVTKEVPVLLVNWDGNTDGRAKYLEGTEDGYCHVSDIVFEDYRELLGKTIHFFSHGEKKTAVLDESMVREYIFKDQTGFKFSDEVGNWFSVAVFSLPEEVEPWEGADPLPRGLYFSFDQNPTGFDYGTGYVIGIETGETTTETTNVIHPIDQKFIVLTSPNGTKYNLYVEDDGYLSTVVAT